MRKNRTFLYLGITIGCVFLVAITAFYLFMRNDYVYRTQLPSYQISGGNKVYFEEGTQFIFDEQGSAIKENIDHKILSNSPIYTKEHLDEIVLAQDYIYINGAKANFGLVKAFNELTNHNELKYKDVYLSGGFLFDGKSCYILLEPMDVNINGKVEHVETFSYIELFDDGMVVVYNTENDTVIVEELIISKLEAQGVNYSIDLLNDIFTDATGTDILIFNNKDVLKEVKN